MSEGSEAAAPREWDASSYDRVGVPQLEWARGVIERLDLRGDELLLDAGCGSGRVTELLVEALPAGRVIGIDGSASMIEHARRRLGDRAELRVGNLLDLELAEPVDAVFSNAVFHWITDHTRLFEVLAGVMRPGARLEAQCGGAGNVDRFTQTAEEVTAEPHWAGYFEGWDRPWRFAGPEETEARLREAGFERARCWLTEAPAAPPQPVEFIRTVCGGPYLERIPEHLEAQFVAELVSRLEQPIVLDYVRLNVSARRG